MSSPTVAKWKELKRKEKAYRMCFENAPIALFLEATSYAEPKDTASTGANPTDILISLARREKKKKHLSDGILPSSTRKSEQDSYEKRYEHTGSVVEAPSTPAPEKRVQIIANRYCRSRFQDKWQLQSLAKLVTKEQAMRESRRKKKNPEWQDDEAERQPSKIRRVKADYIEKGAFFGETLRTPVQLSLLGNVGVDLFTSLDKPKKPRKTKHRSKTYSHTPPPVESPRRAPRDKQPTPPPPEVVDEEKGWRQSCLETLEKTKEIMLRRRSANMQKRKPEDEDPQGAPEDKDKDPASSSTNGKKDWPKIISGLGVGNDKEQPAVLSSAKGSGSDKDERQLKLSAGIMAPWSSDQARTLRVPPPIIIQDDNNDIPVEAQCPPGPVMFNGVTIPTFRIFCIEKIRPRFSTKQYEAEREKERMERDYRKKLEEGLQETRNILHLFVKHAPIGIYLPTTLTLATTTTNNNNYSTCHVRYKHDLLACEKAVVE